MPPEIRFEELRFRVYRGERLAAHGTAARASYRRDTGDYTARTVDVLFAATGDRAEAHLTAPRAAGNARTRDLLAAGGVRAVQGGDVATTEEARYDPADGLVRGDRPIAVRGSGYAANGPAFVFDPRTSELAIQGGTRVEAGRRPRP